MNPAGGGIDMVFGAQPTSYPNVIDIPLCRYPLLCCCSPEYLRGPPEARASAGAHRPRVPHVRAAGQHLAVRESAAPRSASTFNRGCTPTTRRVVLEGVGAGSVLRILPRYIADEDLRSRSGRCAAGGVPRHPGLAEGHGPRMKMDKPAVRELVTFLKTRMQPVAPWDAPDSQDPLWMAVQHDAATVGAD